MWLVYIVVYVTVFTLSLLGYLGMAIGMMIAVLWTWVGLLLFRLLHGDSAASAPRSRPRRRRKPKKAQDPPKRVTSQGQTIGRLLEPLAPPRAPIRPPTRR